MIKDLDFRQKPGPFNSIIWVGTFYKANICGRHEVPIRSKLNRPCDNKYAKCVSFDKGTCVELIKRSKSRYFIYPE